MASPHRHGSGSPAFPLLVLSLLLLSPPGTQLAAGDGGHYPPSSKPIVAPITKDDSTGLYTIAVKSGAPLVLDLAGPLVWSSCPASQAPVPCKVCHVASRNRPAGCAGGGGQQQQQPESADGRCACTVYPYNPASGQCSPGTVAAAPLSANATDGSNPLYPVSFSAYQACVPGGGVLGSLPSGAAGVAGLSREPLSLPSQVASRLKVARQFALCLPSGGQTGVAIFGGGPFHLQGAPPANNDLAEELRQNPLPLLKNPKNDAYYIHLQGIAVNQARVPVQQGAFELDAKHGTGGVAFSTAAPYTMLGPYIFNAVATAFDAATKDIPRRKPLPPFQMCFDASKFTPTRVGPGVANIDLMLDGGRNWTLPGASSLVQVSPGTLCLAFLQMTESEEKVHGSPAVIIGSYQMEDNLVLFDLEKGTVGVSGLLLGRRTNCGNFNFAKGSA